MEARETLSLSYRHTHGQEIMLSQIFAFHFCTSLLNSDMNSVILTCFQ